MKMMSWLNPTPSHLTALVLGFIAFGGVLWSDAANAGNSKAGAASKRPNVLLIISDDLRDRVGCYGNPFIKTPNIDSLAARGLRFDRAYDQYAVCNPSRSSFLTGLRPEQTGVLDNRVCFRDNLPEVVTLPQSFREDGYYTAGYGKVFHAAGGDAEKQARWIDAKLSWDDSHEASFQGGAAAYQRASNSPKKRHNAEDPSKPAIIEGRNLTGGVLRWCEWGATAGPDSLEPDYHTGSAAIAAMDKAGDKPWFIAAGFHRPHDPFIAPKKYFDLYPLDSLKLYHDPKDMTVAPGLAIPKGQDYDAFQKFSEQDKLEFMRAYYACTTFMDAQVGRLLDELTRRGLWTNTIVIFMGDNGYHLGERDWWNKVTVFERCSRVPYIMAGAGVPAGRACAASIELVDLYPTLLDLCGVKPPQSQKLAGESFRPLLENPAGPGKGYAFTMVARGNLIGRSVRTDRWRYTEWDEGRKGTELYDESQDPEENHDLSKNQENAKLIATLKVRFGKLPKAQSGKPLATSSKE